MNEENITIEITAEVKVNGVIMSDAQVEVSKVVIGKIVLPIINVS